MNHGVRPLWLYPVIKVMFYAAQLAYASGLAAADFCAAVVRELFNAAGNVAAGSLAAIFQVGYLGPASQHFLRSAELDDVLLVQA